MTELDVLMFFVEYERTAGMIKTMSGMGGMLEGAGRGRGGLDARVRPRVGCVGWGICLRWVGHRRWEV